MSWIDLYSDFNNRLIDDYNDWLYGKNNDEPEFDEPELLTDDELRDMPGMAIDDPNYTRWKEIQNEMEL